MVPAPRDGMVRSVHRTDGRLYARMPSRGPEAGMGEVAAGRVSARPIGVGVIGSGWMGHVHARAYPRLRHHSRTCRRPRPGRGRRPGPRRPGGRRAVRLRRRRPPTGATCSPTPQVEAVSVTAPNFLHREIGVAVAEAGKHLWIEKPVGLTADDALRWRAAVARRRGAGHGRLQLPAPRRPSPGPRTDRGRRDRAPPTPGAAASATTPPTRAARSPGAIPVARRPRGARRPGLARASTWSGPAR